MKTKFALIFYILILNAAAFAHEPFTLISSEKMTVTSANIQEMGKTQTRGRSDGAFLKFTQNDIRLVVKIGSDNDALSYRIQEMRNPTLVVPTGATLRILFINTDAAMRHDIRFAHRKPPFDLAPAMEGTAGSERLTPHSDDGSFQADDLVLRAVSTGNYTYFCTVRGHARGGMWGNIAVGVEPDAALAQPQKTEHVHSPDEDKEEDGHDHTKPSPTPAGHQHHAPSPTATPASHDGHDAHVKTADNSGDHQMSSTIDIGDPGTREGSGTSWLPDSSPMHAYMKMYKDGGMLMLMGSAFVRYTEIGGSRDVSVAGKGSRKRFDAPNMLMAMYSRPLSERSQIGVRVMASLDPVTQRGWGYPLLYQSGETYGGLPMHDRQHPHDLISELAASYSYKVNDKHSVFIYGGIAGEPALGPPMFLHRPSGMNIPDSPISHHWQDASHITWGVITGGYNFGKAKIEGSVFNGTEPDENRWAFDKPKLDSYSGRFSFNPTKDWAFQVSHAFLKKPERAEPDLDHMHRTTASAMYNKAFSEQRNWASTFVWGQNYKEGKATNSFLFETDYSFAKNAVFGRFEVVQKDGHELVIPHSDPIHEDVFPVTAYSLGYVRDLIKDKSIDVGIGGMATFNFNPAALTPYYGGTRHAGWQLFLRFRPSKTKH